MRAKLVLDDELVNEARRYSAARSTSELVHEALRARVRVRKRRSLPEIRGAPRFAPGYDHEGARAGS
jgi:Arc/MetJ family transcription regulator